jgi:hypothetical protein
VLRLTLTRNALAILLTACLLSLPGCSDDAAGPTPDQGQTKDSSTKDGASPGGDQGVGDATTPGDGKPALACEQECTDFFDWHCVKDPTSGNCKACLEDGHCQINPRSNGPFCDTTAQLCVCKVTTDCAASTTGTKCLQVGNFKTCTCETDADCLVPHSICEGSLVKRCVKPCTTNADCKRGGVTGSCDTSTGKCSFPEV